MQGKITEFIRMPDYLDVSFLIRCYASLLVVSYKKRKSTLINMITDKLCPLKGSISRNNSVRIGIFTQHSTDKFDLSLSSVENMLAMYPGAVDQVMRSFVGKFQIQGDEALKPMMMLSGGQKSRVAFAALAYQQPHVIIMDEPTNHCEFTFNFLWHSFLHFSSYPTCLLFFIYLIVDMESIDALVEALKDFRGGLVVVSHDQYFVTNTCNELWVVGNGIADHFQESFEEYKKETLKRIAKHVDTSVKKVNQINK